MKRKEDKINVEYVNNGRKIRVHVHNNILGTH